MSRSRSHVLTTAPTGTTACSCGGVLGRGDAKQGTCAHAQSAFKGFSQGVGKSGNSFQKRDIKPKWKLMILRHLWVFMAPQPKWWGSAHYTAPVGAVSLYSTLWTRYTEALCSLRENFTFPGHTVLSFRKHLLWGASHVWANLCLPILSTCCCGLSCPVLSCPVLSCPVWPHPIPSHPVLS